MQESSQYEKEITELSLGPPYTPSIPGKHHIVCLCFSIILTIFLTNSYFVALSVFSPNLQHYLRDFDEYSYILSQVSRLSILNFYDLDVNREIFC